MALQQDPFHKIIGVKWASFSDFAIAHSPTASGNLSASLISRSSGDKIWQAAPANIFICRSVAMDRDGSVFVCGEAPQLSDGPIVAKMSAGGSLLWSAFAGVEQATVIATDIDGDAIVYIAGDGYYKLSGQSGGTLWQISDTGISLSLACGRDGEFWAVERELSGNSVTLRKYSAETGTLITERSLSGEISGDLAVHTDGTVVVATTAALTKHATTGDIIWSKGGEFVSVDVDSGGSVYASSGGTGLITKYDSDGNAIWQVSNRVPYLIAASNGVFAVERGGDNNTLYNVYKKYSSDGELQYSGTIDIALGSSILDAAREVR